MESKSTDIRHRMGTIPFTCISQQPLLLFRQQSLDEPAQIQIREYGRLHRS
jgi:hypothetical protein